MKVECEAVKSEHTTVFQLQRDEGAFKRNYSAPVFYYHPDEFCFFSPDPEKETDRAQGVCRVNGQSSMAPDRKKNGSFPQFL